MLKYEINMKIYVNQWFEAIISTVGTIVLGTKNGQSPVLAYKPDSDTSVSGFTVTVVVSS